MTNGWDPAGAPRLSAACPPMLLVWLRWFLCAVLRLFLVCSVCTLLRTRYRGAVRVPFVMVPLAVPVWAPFVHVPPWARLFICPYLGPSSLVGPPT